MKNMLLALLFLFGTHAFCQSKPVKPTTETPSSEKVVKKALYTKKEKEKARKEFLKAVDTMGLAPNVKTEYLAIIEKHTARLKAVNKDRKLTKSQATHYVNTVMEEQNLEVQRVLTVDQYRNHLVIADRYQSSIIYRIEKQ